MVLPYVPLALAAAVGFSLNAIWAKVTAKHAIPNRDVFLFYFYLLGFAFVPLLFLVGPIGDPRVALPQLAGFTVTFFLGSIFITTVLYRFDISVLQPFFHFQTIFSVILAYLVLREVFPLTAYLWILGIIVGGVLVSTDERFRPRAILSRDFLLFLSGIALYAVSDIFAKQAVQALGVFTFKFWSDLTLGLLGILFLLRVGAQARMPLRALRPLIISKAFFFLATLALFAAFSFNITVSQPLAMLGSLFTVLFAAVLARIRPEFLEAHPPRVYAVRGAGVLLMLASAVLLARVTP